MKRTSSLKIIYPLDEVIGTITSQLNSQYVHSWVFHSSSFGKSSSTTSFFFLGASGMNCIFVLEEAPALPSLRTWMNNINARYVPSKAGDRMRARKRAPVSAIRRAVTVENMNGSVMVREGVEGRNVQNRISSTVMVMSDSIVAITMTMVIMKNENPLRVMSVNDQVKVWRVDAHKRYHGQQTQYGKDCNKCRRQRMCFEPSYWVAYRWSSILFFEPVW